jgi:hypothetical protein
MGIKTIRLMERGLAYIQCKVLWVLKSLKFGNGSRPVLGHPSPLGARPLSRAPVPSGAEADGQAREPQRRSPRACARGDGGASLTNQPTETEENKM